MSAYAAESLPSTWFTGVRRINKIIKGRALLSLYCYTEK